MPLIPQQPHWTGLVRTGTAKRPRLREQCLLLDFDLLAKEIKKTLQDQILDVSQDLQALTLMEETDKSQPKAQVMDTEVPEDNDKAKDDNKAKK